MVKICPICKQSFPTKAALAQHMNAVHTRRAPRNASNRSNMANTITGSEYLGSKTELQVLEIFPGKTGASRLDTMAGIYELFQIKKWTYRFKPIVSTSTSGYYLAGVCYEATNRPNSEVSIASCQPSVQAPIYKASSISVSPQLVMGQPWLPTANKSGTSPGAVVLNVTKNTNVAVWVDYTVSFSGPTSVARSTDVAVLNDPAKGWISDGQQVKNFKYEYTNNIDIEIGSADQTIVDRVIEMLKKGTEAFQELHRFTTGAITFVHSISSFINVILSITAVPVIIHVQRRPFPAIRSEWLRYSGNRPFEREDPPPESHDTETDSVELLSDYGEC